MTNGKLLKSLTNVKEIVYGRYVGELLRFINWWIDVRDCVWRGWRNVGYNSSL